MKTHSNYPYGPYDRNVADKHPQECEVRMSWSPLFAAYGGSVLREAFCVRPMNEDVAKTTDQVASKHVKTKQTYSYGPYPENVADKHPQECTVRTSWSPLFAAYGGSVLREAFCTRPMNEDVAKTTDQVASKHLKK